MCSSRQGSPLDGGPTVAAVVPQDDLSWVSPPHHQVGMKPGKAHRYYRRLRKEKESEGERMRQQNRCVLLWCDVILWKKLSWPDMNKEHGENRNGLVGWNVEIKQKTVRKEQKQRQIWSENGSARRSMSENKGSRQRDGWQTWGDRRRRRWWARLRWGSAEERREGWRWGGDQTKRGIVVLFPPAVSYYSIKTPAATGALTVASIMTSAPLNSLPPQCRVYWVLVPLQCSSHKGFCVQELAFPDPEPLKHLCCGVMRKCFSIVVLQEGKWCYALTNSSPPSIHLAKQHNHVERNDNLQARWSQESIKQEAHRHTAQLKTVKL